MVCNPRGYLIGEVNIEIACHISISGRAMTALSDQCDVRLSTQKNVQCRLMVCLAFDSLERQDGSSRIA
jgi:hypothetical protein